MEKQFNLETTGNMNIDDEVYITIKKAAEICNLKYLAMYKIATNNFRCVKFAHVIMVRLEDVEEYNKHRQFIKKLKR